MGQALWEHLEPQYFESSIHYRLSEGGLKDCNRPQILVMGSGFRGLWVLNLPLRFRAVEVLISELRLGSWLAFKVSARPALLIWLIVFVSRSGLPLLNETFF